MTETTLNMTLQLRRAAFQDSCVLKEGEPGYHTETGEFKIGDGTTQWSELKLANETQIKAWIKAVDDKVAALNDTYATDSEVEAVRTALQANIDKKLDKSTYDTYVGTHAMTDAELKKYAEDEADAAQTAAAKDATDKAGQALADAKKYADDKKTEAIDAAAEDATTKANTAQSKAEATAASALTAARTALEKADTDNLTEAKEYADGAIIGTKIVEITSKFDPQTAHQKIKELFE